MLMIGVGLRFVDARFTDAFDYVATTVNLGPEYRPGGATSETAISLQSTHREMKANRRRGPAAPSIP